MPTLSYRVIALVLFLLLPLSTYYSLLPNSAPAEPVSLTDATGRKVTLPETPARVISLAPSITEILFALGLDEQIVGVTTACDYPDRARAKPSVGGAISPDLEIMLRLKPDVVLGIKGLQRPGLTEELDRLGLRVYWTDPSSLERTLHDIRRIGQVVNRTNEAATLIREMEGQMEKVRARVHSLPRPRVLYVLWNDPLMTVTADTYIGEMIELAGGENLSPPGPKGYIQLGMEQVLARDPDVVIFASEMGEGTAAAERDRWSRWEQLSAVRNGRLHVLNSDLLHRPGPRLGRAVEALAEVLHPRESAAEKGVAPSR